VIYKNFNKALIFIAVILQCYEVNSQGLIFSSGVSVSTQAYSNINITRTVQGHHNIVSAYSKVAYEISVKPNWFIQFGCQHVEKGYKYEGRNIGNAKTNYNLTYEYRLNYIEIPLIFTYRRNKIGYNFGVSGSYMYRANYRYFDESFVQSNGVKSVYRSSYFGEYPFERYQKWDIGLLVGLNYKLSKKLIIDLVVTKHMIRTDFVGPQIGYNDIMYQQVYMLGLNYFLLNRK